MSSEDEFKVYKEKPYTNSNKEPFGITISSKSKAFITAHQNVKKMLRKGKVYQIDRNEIKVVDVTNNLGLFVAILEVGEVNEEKGNVEIKVHAPGKKGATIELRKMSGFEYHYVELLKSMITAFIDGFISGEDVGEMFKKGINNKTSKKRVTIKTPYYYCDLCNFQSRFSQGLKAHKTKIHTKENLVKCDKCDFVTTAKSLLDIHDKNTHTNTKKRANISITPTSSPPQKKHEGNNKEHANKGSDVDPSNVEMIDVESEAKDVVFDMLQARIDELEASLAKSEEKVNTLQKKNAEFERKIKELEDNDMEKKSKKNESQAKKSKIPDHLHPVKEEHLSKLKGYRMIFKAQPNGACLDNCAAVHIYEDVDEAPKLKKRINNHVADNFDHYAQWFSLPYAQTVGVGKHSKNVTINTKEQMIEFLRSEDALMVYSDSQQILAMANLFNMNIYTFTYGSTYESWTLVTPEPEMAKHAEIKFGKFVPDMALYHSNDTHFDLLVSDDSRLALLGLLAGIDNEEATKAGGDWVEVTKKRKNEEEKMIPEKEVDEVGKDCQEELELFFAKQSGFSRTSPQNQSERKFKSNPMFTCDQCGYKLQSKQLLTAHLATHVESHLFKCDFCDESFVTSNLLDKHIQRTHRETKYNCCSCEKTFEKNSLLEEHIQNEHTKIKNNCDKRDNTFKSISEQEKHEKNVHQVDEWNCNGCAFQANDVNELINHLKITGHQPSKYIELKKFFNEYKQCYTCKMEFDGYYKLMSHRKDVHPSKKKCRNPPQSCPWGKTCWYVHQDEPMDVDQNSVNTTPSSSTFNCSSCGEVIEGRNNFMTHKKTKHSDTILPCENYLKGSCGRNEETCWFKHSPIEVAYKATNQQQNPVFPEAHPNAFPPDQMSEMKKMMNSLYMKIIEHVDIKFQAILK